MTNNFVTFRHISNGVIASYPAHYENHPVFGADLERYEPGAEYEEEKVVVDDSHELPVEKRTAIFAKKPVKDTTAPVADREDNRGD